MERKQFRVTMILEGEDNWTSELVSLAIENRFKVGDLNIQLLDVNMKWAVEA